MKLLGILTLVLLVAAIRATLEYDLTHETRTFAAKLYKELISAMPNQNVIFSPIYLQTVLALLVSGSTNENDQVIQQIRTLLSLPRGNSSQAAFKSVLDHLGQSDNDFKLFDATKIYLKPGYWVEEWYRNISRHVFRSEIESIDFRTPTAASQTINQWVAEKTNNKIKNIIDQNDISPNTQNLLISASYLKGNWYKPYNQHENVIKNFNSPNEVQQVTMMTGRKIHEYYEDDDAQYLRFGIVRNGEAEMVFVLPRQQDGLGNLENDIQKLLQPVKFYPTEVTVTLPMFSFSNNMKLKLVLQNIGVTKFFVWGAQLNGLRYPGHPFIKITDVFHQTLIDVNEWGVTDAKTVMDTPCSSVDYDYGLNQRNFTADHPFFFYITIDDAVVYTGRVMEI